MKKNQSTCSYHDGTYYQGEMQGDKRQGHGILYQKDSKKIYEGAWYNDKFHGKGIHYNMKENKNFSQNLQNIPFEKALNNWLSYEGDFKEDNWDGVGKLFFVNREEFYGEFKNGVIDGKGSFYSLNGEIIMGLWENNHIRIKI